MIKKALVTGGAGFIGSHLSKKLIERGYQVVILDDLSTGKIENIENLLKANTASFIEGSVTKLALLKKLTKDTTYVFHLAAFASVPRSIENPLACHKVNADGTLNVLLASRDSKVKKVVFASSAAVYGDTPTLPQKENMTLRPLSPYAVTKVTGEYYCRVFQQAYDLSTASLRYFNVYGPRQDPNSQYASVIPRFIKEVSQEKPPIIFGDGEQTRDFAFVKDVVDATILAAETNATGVFNIARGRSVSINELTRLVIRIMGKNIEPLYEEPRAGDIKHSLADISRAKAFGYKPKYNLEAGIKEMIRGY
ncbi:MAG: SDR family oxidoreductase [Chloroflexota bacterium]